MGFLNSCLETLLRLAAFSNLIDHEHGQQPLRLPSWDDDVSSSTAGVVFAPQNASTPGFQCRYPSLGQGWTACQAANDRGCWLKHANKAGGYNIHTDYEVDWPQGVTREYWLEVEQTAITADGYVKSSGLTFNGTYPGPVIEACWGDKIIVHVTNKIVDNGTTIHWHGVRQLGTNEYDGVNGVTQCPIAKGETFTYRFTASQYGHTWYHSHYQLQYSDGIAGPLTIYGPSSANYDEALQPALISDWMHDSSDQVFLQELHGAAPVVDSIVFNGTGNFRCSNLDPKCCSPCSASKGPGKCTPDPDCPSPSAPNFGGSPFKLSFQPGKRYLLRLINASAQAMYIFSIDGHDFEVVATDLVAIKPYKTDSVFLGIGQRYTIIVQAKSDKEELDAVGGNYWMRTRVAIGCGTIVEDDETTGVLTYSGFNFTATPSTHTQQFRTLCEDEPRASLNPVVPWFPKPRQIVNAKEMDKYTFEAGIEDTLAPTDSGFARWDLLDQGLFLNYSDPTIVHTDDLNFNYPGSYCVVDYNFTRGYVYLIITAQNLTDSAFRDKREVPAAHPIHLHGHDFVILAQENNTFDAGRDVPNFNYNNPPRRDVAMLDTAGYLALAFKPDNPGVWLVHCHIAFHAASGLALQIMERESEISGFIGHNALAPIKQGCQSWEKWNLTFHQLDSGI